MDLGLHGRRAVVTGGSKGIGLAVAAELVREGADVAICSRHGDELDAAAGELRAGGGTVHAQVADVTDPGQVTDFIDAAAASWETIWNREIVQLGYPTPVGTPGWAPPT